MVRFFTSAGELTNCGHGIIAAQAVVLHRSGTTEHHGSLRTAGRTFATTAIRRQNGIEVWFDQGVIALADYADATAGGIIAALDLQRADIESILTAWHDRQIDHHLQEMVRVRDHTTGAAQRLEAVLTAYVKAISHRRPHDNDIAGMLHRGEHVAAAHQQLREFIRELIADAAAAGAVRQDVPADELTIYCLHALAAATMLHRPAAIRRLIQTTLTGLRASDPQ